MKPMPETTNRTGRFLMRLFHQLESCGIRYCVMRNYEGLPNSVLEAMAAGKPVISTVVGGVPEIIKEGQNGFLVPYGNQSRFAEKIINLITNSSLLDKMSENARLESNNFDISRYHCDLMDVYHRPKKMGAILFKPNSPLSQGHPRNQGK